MNIGPSPLYIHLTSTWLHTCDKCSQAFPAFCPSSTPVCLLWIQTEDKNGGGLGTRLTYGCSSQYCIGIRTYWASKLQEIIKDAQRPLLVCRRSAFCLQMSIQFKTPNKLLKYLSSKNRSNSSIVSLPDSDQRGGQAGFFSLTIPL